MSYVQILETILPPVSLLPALSAKLIRKLVNARLHPRAIVQRRKIVNERLHPIAMAQRRKIVNARLNPIVVVQRRKRRRKKNEVHYCNIALMVRLYHCLYGSICILWFFNNAVLVTRIAGLFRLCFYAYLMRLSIVSVTKRSYVTGIVWHIKIRLLFGLSRALSKMVLHHVWWSVLQGSSHILA